MRGAGAAIALGLAAMLAAFWWLGRDRAGEVSPEVGTEEVRGESGAELVPATSVPGGEDDATAPKALGTGEAPASSEGASLARGVTLFPTGEDATLAGRGLARLEVVVREGEATTPLVNHPVRVESQVFRPGREVAPERRTDAEGRVELEVPADEALRVLVLEEFRNVTMLEERARPIAAGTVGRLEVTVPLPPLVEMWVAVVADADGAPVEGARVWIEKLLRIDGEPVLETFVEEYTDARGRARLAWPDVPSLGGRAAREGVGEARFVPVDRRGTEDAPFEVRLGVLPVRGSRDAR